VTLFADDALHVFVFPGGLETKHDPIATALERNRGTAIR